MAFEWQPLIGSSFISFLLSFMLMKAWLPFAPKRQEEVLLEVPLPLVQRLMIHRTQGILLLIYLLLGSLPDVDSQWFLPGTQIAGLVGLAVIVMLPLRYVLTTAGVSLNGGASWPWKSFRRYDVRQGTTLFGVKVLSPTTTINLTGRQLAKGRASDRTLHLPATVTAEATRIVRKCVR